MDILSKLHFMLCPLILSTFEFASALDFIRIRPHVADTIRLSHKYKKIRGISLMNCLVQCQLETRCKAVSYSERFWYCELNDNSGLHDDVASSVIGGWKTYNVVNETAGTCKTGWCNFEGSCYLFVINGIENKRNWSDAADRCAVEGAGLVRIESEAEDDFLLAKIEELNGGQLHEMIFTAGNDIEEEGSWTWSGRPDETETGPMGYANWYQGEPNDLGGEIALQ